MGCNHCLEPSCLIGCPVEAYTKDPVTGVVIHSADACIGCQYCTWNCSYGVPQYNPERGVVGKCDMCHNRLSDGMAPACVAACPEGAIAIEIVDIAEWRGNYLGANAPGFLRPTTAFPPPAVTLPENLFPDTGRVDTQRIVPEHPHWPLVFMLVLTQLSAGAFAALWVAREPRPWSEHFGLVAWLAGIGRDQPGRGDLASGPSGLCVARSQRSAAILAEPRSSELVDVRRSRRGSMLECASCIFRDSPRQASLTVLCACIGVMCSARIYMVPARPAWNSRYTLAEFFSTALLLGPLFVQGWIIRL